MPCSTTKKHYFRPAIQRLYMNKILLITRREYLSRVRKRSFIVMTLLGPLLIAAFYGIIFYLAINKNIGSKQKQIGVVDHTKMIREQLHGNDQVSFVDINNDDALGRSMLKENRLDAVLFIPSMDTSYNMKEANFETVSQPGLTVISYVEAQIEHVVDSLRFAQQHIDMERVKSLQSSVHIKTIKNTEAGQEESSSLAYTVAGLIGAVLIYMFIFLYGVQVMRGVIEEKTNRIVEVMISSVKPFQLMMGKIIGIALVGLTQFIIWVLLTTISFTAVTSYLASETGKSKEEVQKAAIEARMGAMNPAAEETADQFVNFHAGIDQLNFPLIICMFLFYFITGYLFYGALFAAVGSAVDSETDTQQFMLPITLPLIFGLVLAQTSVLNDPEGSLAFWLSIIPLTSPIVMMVRVPFIGHFSWEIALSMGIMVISFLGAVWIAGRIYRTGILMYGKKVSYKELGKWLFYR
jgi:ABC-2 type transport system permease protein